MSLDFPQSKLQLLSRQVLVLLNVNLGSSQGEVLFTLKVILDSLQSMLQFLSKEALILFKVNLCSSQGQP